MQVTKVKPFRFSINVLIPKYGWKHSTVKLDIMTKRYYTSTEELHTMLKTLEWFREKAIALNPFKFDKLGSNNSKLTVGNNHADYTKEQNVQYKTLNPQHQKSFTKRPQSLEFFCQVLSPMVIRHNRYRTDIQVKYWNCEAIVIKIIMQYNFKTLNLVFNCFSCH